MINLSTSGNAVVFTFTDSDRYLYGTGTITVPLNSLLLVTDSSNMATFKKAASNDVFVSALYSELGMTKDELISWFEENMVGGGGSVDSGTVESMISEATSGKADTSAVTESINAAVSGKADSSAVTAALDEKQDISNLPTLIVGNWTYNKSTHKVSVEKTLKTSGGRLNTTSSVITINNQDIFDNSDVSNLNLVETSAITSSVTSASTDTEIPSAKAVWDAIPASITVDFTFDSGSTNPLANSAITDHLNTVESVIATSLNDLNERKLDASAYTPTDLSNYYTKSQTSGATQISTALNAKQDTLVAGDNITISGNVISAEGGGGASYSAGRGIDITDDTISFNLPISAGTETGALIIASDTYDLNNKATGNYSVSLNGGDVHPNYAKGNRSLAEGSDTIAFGENCHSEGHATSAGTNSYPFTSNAHAEGGYTHAAGGYSHAEGYYTKANNSSEHASGRYNVSNTGSTDADKTLFSVGNGTSSSARHNAFEIRKNGDIYINKDGQDIKLQDNLGSEVSSAITSGDTNAVAGGAVYSKFDEVEQVTAAALNALNDNFGGLKLVKLTQQEYDALSTKDSNTLYVIV